MGRESCPVIAGGSCRLAESADLIVQSFPSKDRRRFPILEALRKSLPDTPVCVEVAKPSFWKFADALDGCTVVDQPMRSSTLVAAVDDLAARLEKDN
jgi:hypothetical protein